MSTGAFLIARLGSTRLPRKNILPIMGKPMIQLLAERVGRAKAVDKVVIATSTQASDDALEELADEIGVGCHRGPLDNVMERITGAATAYNCDNIIEILGDNPLVHGALIDDVCRLYKEGGYDYAANITREYEPSCENRKLFSVGLRVQVYTLAAARAYIDYPKYPDNDRHPCAYIFDHPDRFKVGYLEAVGRWGFMNRPDINFAVNYGKNFEFVEKVFQRHYAADPDFPLQAIYQQMDEEPELFNLLGAD